MQATPADGGFVGRCDLGIAHERPTGSGHGGVSAMLLDELMG
jgi:acyl-coenzyme A thioesterase PaaI-like protein